MKCLVGVESEIAVVGCLEVSGSSGSSEMRGELLEEWQSILEWILRKVQEHLAKVRGHRSWQDLRMWLSQNVRRKIVADEGGRRVYHAHQYC